MRGWSWKNCNRRRPCSKDQHGESPRKTNWEKSFSIRYGNPRCWDKIQRKSILEEATDPTNNIILFIDELHTIIGAGGQDQNDAAQMLKPLLSR